MVTVALLALLLLCSLWWFQIYGKRKRNLPPGPLAIPLLGHLHVLGKNPHRSLSSLSKRYGSIMSIKLGMVPTVVVSSPDAAKAVLYTHDINFSSRPKIEAPKHLFYNARDIAWSEYGPYWRKIRKISTVELFTGKRVEQFKQLRTEEVSRLINSIAQEGRNGEIPVRMNAMLSMANMNLVSLMAVNQRFEDSEFVSLLQDVLKLLVAFVPGDYFPFLSWMNDTREMKVVHGKLDKVFQRMIDQRRQQSRDTSSTDFLDLLLSLDELDDDNRKALIMDVFVASSDTSSITTEWALAELIKNPSCMVKVQQEIDRVVGRDRAVTEEDLSSLSYLRAVVKETFRLHPVAPLLLPHQSTEDCMVNGLLIPANTRVTVNVWSIGRDPRWWESPEAFNPERFHEASALDVKGQHFELLPFGSGRRMCPGMSLGLIMVEISLARLIQAFEWDATVKDLDMDEEFGLTVRMKIPLNCFARTRI